MGRRVEAAMDGTQRGEGYIAVFYKGGWVLVSLYKNKFADDPKMGGVADSEEDIRGLSRI